MDKRSGVRCFYASLSVFIGVLFRSSRGIGLRSSLDCRSWSRIFLLVAVAVASGLDVAQAVGLVAVGLLAVK